MMLLAALNVHQIILLYLISKAKIVMMYQAAVLAICLKLEPPWLHVCKYKTLFTLKRCEGFDFIPVNIVQFKQDQVLSYNRLIDEVLCHAFVNLTLLLSPFSRIPKSKSQQSK